MTTAIPIAVLDDSLFADHCAMGPHPECADRLEAAREGLRAGLGNLTARTITARPATREELCRIHRPRYLDHLADALRGPPGHLDPDTFHSVGSYDAAWCAAGGVVDLVDALWSNQARHGIALVRPPGHHAEADHARGFCLLNNVAIAAAALLARGAQRVAVVDWDVHHGNGTQNAFYGDPRVLFISMHQWPFYPGTGAVTQLGTGAGFGFNANVPLPAGSGPAAYGAVFRRVVVPMLQAFAPEMILVSAGFDAHTDDPLASMELDASTFQAMATALIRDVAQGDAQRIAWILEGGYDLAALSSSVAAVTRAATGRGCDLPQGRVPDAQLRAIDTAVTLLQPHWSTLR